MLLRVIKDAFVCRIDLLFSMLISTLCLFLFVLQLVIILCPHMLFYMDAYIAGTWMTTKSVMDYTTI